MPRITRATMLKERRCGLKYYDQAVAQTSHQALVDKAVGYVQQHPGVWGTGWANFDWAFGNAVIGTILPNKDISQTYNLRDVLSETDIVYIQSKLPQMVGFPPDAGQGSKMSNVYIKIGGLTNTGKTSVAVIIEKALIEAGFNVKPFTNRDGDADTKRQWLTEGKLPIKTSEINIELEEVRLVRKLTDE